MDRSSNDRVTQDLLDRWEEGEEVSAAEMKAAIEAAMKADMAGESSAIYVEAGHDHTVHKIIPFDICTALFTCKIAFQLSCWAC